MRQIEFEITESGEPHAQRRRELLARYPDIRALFGFDRRTALVTVGLVITQLSLAGFIGWRVKAGEVFGSWWMVLIASYVVGAPLTHWLAMAIHETSHRLALRTAWGNTALALFANAPMVLPFAISFNRYHLAHHQALNVLGEDTDIPLGVEVALIGNSTPRKLAAVFLHPLVYLVRGATFAKRPTREEILNGLLILCCDLVIARYLGGAALAYLSLAFLFALGLHPVAAHFIHEHYTYAEGQETFSYYGPLNRICFNVGYHNEHHDFMNVPGRRLPELRQLVPDYDALVSHTSWTGILWRFITDPEMGYGRRIVRSPEAYRRGRVETARQRGLRRQVFPPSPPTFHSPGAVLS